MDAKTLEKSSIDLVEVYTKQIRCVLELAAPAWQGSLSQVEKQDLERVQKSACHIILGESYSSYRDSLNILGLDPLESRRNTLALKFAVKSEKHAKFKFWFKPAIKKVNTRRKIEKYYDVRAIHTRFARSPISFPN